ncbi:hypothetical protein ACP70R_024028 [Stipagrostis hirtigluma subsp. patula]
MAHHQDEQQQQLLRVLHTSLVAPSPPLHAHHDDGELSLPLTYLDAMWLAFAPVEVERVFFYRLAPDADIAAIVSNLTASLSRALHAFFPLAARLRLIPATTNRYELYYNPAAEGGAGVSFTVAEYDGADIDDLATDEPREHATIAPLVPHLPEGGAVLALQATLLRARRGLALGVAVHHAACDGSASTHFLHTWAAWAAGADTPPQPPVVDRAIIRDRKDLHDMFTTPRPSSDAHDIFNASADPRQVLATFTLSPEQLQHVKDTVAGEAARRGVPPPRCTSVVATFGFVWRCHYQAKASSSSSSGDRAYLGFPIDLRRRLDPPVPDKYLGNCVGPCIVSAPKTELAAAGADGLFAACAAVAAAIDEAVRGGESGYWNWLMERVTEAYSDGRPLSVAGSPRFRVYGVDFGFGPPAKVDIVSVANTGAISVAESRAGSGGIEVGISLLPDAMDRFQSCFADAITSLPALHAA